MTTTDELKELCTRGESKTREFKRELSDEVLKDLSTDLAAMANTEGGTIFVGVEDDGALVGFARRPRQQDRDRVSTEAQNCNPPVQIDFENVSFAHLEFLLIKVQADAAIHQDKSRRFPCRVGDRIVHMDTAGVIGQLNARNLLSQGMMSSLGGESAPGIPWPYAPAEPDVEPKKPSRLSRREATLLLKTLESGDRAVQEEGLEELRRLAWRDQRWYDKRIFQVLADFLKSGDEKRVVAALGVIRSGGGLQDEKRRRTVSDYFRREILSLTMPPAPPPVITEALYVLEEFRDKSVVPVLLRWVREIDDDTYSKLGVDAAFNNFSYYGYYDEGKRELLSALVSAKSVGERSRLIGMLKALRQYGGR